MQCMYGHEAFNSSDKVIKAFIFKSYYILILFLLIYSIKHFNNNLSCKNKKKTEKVLKNYSESLKSS